MQQEQCNEGKRKDSNCNGNDLEKYNELNDVTMSARFLFLGNQYLNVPGGNKVHYYHDLISAVEDIGRTYGIGKGSNLKKGIVFIQAQSKCPSKRSVKMVLRSVHGPLIRDNGSEEYIFRCHMDYFIEILETIFKNIPDNNHGDNSKIDYYIPYTKRGLGYVEQNAYDEETRKKATAILNSISCL